MVDAIGAGRAFGQRLGKLLEDEIHRVVQDCLYGTDFDFIPKGQLTDLHSKRCTHDGLVVDTGSYPYEFDSVEEALDYLQSWSE